MAPVALAVIFCSRLAVGGRLPSIMVDLGFHTHICRLPGDLSIWPRDHLYFHVHAICPDGGGFYGNSLPQLYGGKLPGWILADSLARRGLQPLTPIGLVEMATQRELTIASLLRISVQ